MKALYADDNVEIRDYVAMLLEAGLDCEILEASSGNEAISILEFEEGLVDFVITEVEMKGGNGNLIIEYFDKNQITIPIVWLSDLKNKDSMIVLESLTKGSLNAFVPKPFKDDQFFPIINRILEQRSIKGTDVVSSVNVMDLSEGENHKNNRKDWNFICEEKIEGESVADWDLRKKAITEGEDVADWDLRKKAITEGEDVADWDLRKKTITEGEDVADWDIRKKTITEGEEVADWGLKKNITAGEEVADWGFKKNITAGEDVADWEIGKKEYGSSEDEADWSLIKDEQTQEIEKEAVDDKNNLSITYLDQWDQFRHVEQVDKNNKLKNNDTSKEELDQEYDKDRFRRIKIKRLLNFNQVCCDIYLKLSKVKYLKIINQNESYEDIDILKYIDKKIIYLFVLKKDYLRFSEMFGYKVMNMLEASQSMSTDIVMLAELSAFEHSYKMALEFGISTSTASTIKGSIESNLKTIKKSPNVNDILQRIMKGRNYISEHSLFLSYIVGQIAMGTSYGNVNTLEKLSMAAMFHDIGIEDAELCRIHDLYPEQVKSLASDQKKVIDNHLSFASSLIGAGEVAYSDVESIIIQHHEKPDQGGYPRGIGALNISPLSAIFIIGHEFINRIHGKEKSEENIKEITKNIKDDFYHGNFKKPLDAFSKLF